MKRPLLVAAACCAASAPGAARRAPLPPYSEAIRCAALTEAAAKLATGTAEEAPRFDEAMFWGLAASESARKAKLSSARFKQDQRESATAALARLEAADAGAAAELAACRKRVPPLDKAKPRRSP